MHPPNLAERVQVLHADLAHVRRQGQFRGSGATIHALINQVSTAQSALRLAETRGSETKSDDIEELLDLAEACLRQARSLIAASARSVALRASPTFAA